MCEIDDDDDTALHHKNNVDNVCTLYLFNCWVRTSLYFESTVCV